MEFDPMSDEIPKSEIAETHQDSELALRELLELMAEKGWPE
jgi:hypothetical protein